MTITIPSPAFFDLISFFLGAASLFGAIYGAHAFRDWRREVKWRKQEKARKPPKLEPEQP